MTSNRGQLILSKRKIKNVLIAILIIAAILCLCIADEVTVRNAEQSPNIMQVKQHLQGDYSFTITLEGWAEKTAMKRVIKQYNKEKGYNTKEEMYTIYKLTEDDYWVTNERLSYREFAHTASDFYTCLGDMLSGIQKEKKEFYFIYTTENMREDLAYVLAMASLSENELNIDIKPIQGKEATIVLVTVEPKSSEKGGI